MNLRTIPAFGPMTRAIPAALFWPVPAFAQEAGGILDRPLDISRDGHQIDFIIDKTILLVSIYFALVLLALVWFMIRYRQREGHRRGYYFHGYNLPSIGIQVAVGVLVFLTVDLQLNRLSLEHLEKTYYNYPSRQEALRIEIMPQQWAWNIRYAGPDDRFNTGDDVVTLNDLRVPRGTPVIIQLKAKDVIHSLFLPNVRLKQDAIPGRVTQFWFEPVMAGRFEMVCAEHCGLNHYKMRGDFRVLEPAEFEFWLEEAQKISAIAFDPQDEDALWGWEWEGIE